MHPYTGSKSVRILWNTSEVNSFFLTPFCMWHDVDKWPFSQSLPQTEKLPSLRLPRPEGSHHLSTIITGHDYRSSRSELVGYYTKPVSEGDTSENEDSDTRRVSWRASWVIGNSSNCSKLSKEKVNLTEYEKTNILGTLFMSTSKTLYIILKY